MKNQNFVRNFFIRTSTRKITQKSAILKNRHFSPKNALFNQKTTKIQIFPHQSYFSLLPEWHTGADVR